MTNRRRNPNTHARPAFSPSLRWLLSFLRVTFTLLAANGAYLLTVRTAEWVRDRPQQNYFFQYMFLLHLAVGLVILLPTVVFGVAHLARAWYHPNRRTVRRGYVLLVSALCLLASGVLLMRVEGILVIRHPHVRRTIYWVHVLAPLLVIGFYITHRRTMPRLMRWRVGGRHAAGGTVLCVALLALHVQDPRHWGDDSPEPDVTYFEPSLARTASGGFIPVHKLVNDQYCLECHADIHEGWRYSAHHISSFNNAAYLASVRETRSDLAARDGHARASRFCAGCHDPAPFFSGAFDDPKYDDPDYDLANDPLAQAGITCTTCHSIVQINSPRGNADYTIEDPLHYPFTFTDNGVLKWINHTLVRANPSFHKQTFLKPLHKTAEFCGSCHKVHLPEVLNDYRFLRGQNHYDSFLLSGVSGHGVASFYYPERAESNCNGCHMPLHVSADFGAALFDDSGNLKIHDHQFPSGNTALKEFADLPDAMLRKYERFNEGVMRLDLFGVKEGGAIVNELVAPIRPQIPVLKPGQTYLLETVIRTLKIGHHFTQGTVDSNQVWLDVTVAQGGRVIGRSGGRDASGKVDPWTHFVNAFVVDSEGRRIDRRNAEDIFVSLYDHQIPPGAGQVVHFRLMVPRDSAEPLTVELALRYRKFDTDYVRYYRGDSTAVNDLPILTLARDQVTFAIAGGPTPPKHASVDFPVWQRWNDYGIGLLREGNRGPNRGELRQAELAFREVERLGRPDGPLNRARVYLKEGRLEDAVAALSVAADFEPSAPTWTQLWLTGMVNQQYGALDEAVRDFRAILELDTEQTRRRGFDFRLDYRLLNQLGLSLLERSKQERGAARRDGRHQLLREAAGVFQQSLQIDPENVVAHYNLALIYELLGETERARPHRESHSKYKLDDNARDRAIIAARARYPAADYAANAIVIWDLHRPGAYGLEPREERD